MKIKTPILMIHKYQTFIGKICLYYNLVMAPTDKTAFIKVGSSQQYMMQLYKIMLQWTEFDENTHSHVMHNKRHNVYFTILDTSLG